MKKKIILIIIVLLIFITFFILVFRHLWLQSVKAPETIVEEIQEAVIEEIEKGKEHKKELDLDNKDFKNTPINLNDLPRKVKISVPFTSQAPYKIWDERHQEACEEASLTMVVYFLKNKFLSPEIAEKEIQALIDFQINRYGEHKDATVAGTIQLARDFYGLENLEAVYDFDREAIKKELAANKPVIIPAAGRELKNPYYTQPGPLYHMLVLTGYVDDIIITNDPGTRRGEGYRYRLDVLYNAIHDFPGKKDKIRDGRKAMIVVR